MDCKHTWHADRCLSCNMRMLTYVQELEFALKESRKLAAGLHKQLMDEYSKKHTHTVKSS